MLADNTEGTSLMQIWSVLPAPVRADYCDCIDSGEKQDMGCVGTQFKGQSFCFCFLGRDFSHDDTLDVPTQVELLIKQATSHENLCQCYIGW